MADPRWRMLPVPFAEYIILCNFGGLRMSDIEIIVRGLRGRPRGRPGLNRVKLIQKRGKKDVIKTKRCAGVYTL